jgi:hypothetical protein
MALFHERRGTIRLAANGQLNVECEQEGPPLRLIDVGAGGFSAQAISALPIGAVQIYRFTTPNRAWSALFKARAVYCRPESVDGRPTGRYVAGFCFVRTDPPAVQEQLMSMLDLMTGPLAFS